MYLLDCDQDATNLKTAPEVAKAGRGKGSLRSIDPPLNDRDFSRLTDEELVARCQNGMTCDTRSFDELVRRFQPVVLNYSKRFVGNPLDAEEICQDAFLRVFKCIHKFEGRSSFRTWLFRIVTNLCLSQRGTLAKRRERQDRFTEEATTLFQADMADAGTEDLAHRIQLALGQLDEQKREIVNLKFVSGLQIEEIAAMLNLKLSATKMRLYRARDELREAYFQQTEESVAA